MSRQISTIVRDAGYDFWFRYGDSYVKSRKLKFMQNGFQHTKKQYSSWDKKIRAGLKAAGVEFLSAGFQECFSWRGPYKAYIIKIPRQA